MRFLVKPVSFRMILEKCGYDNCGCDDLSIGCVFD